MANNDQQPAPTIAPPLIILICIAGGVVFVIVIAVVSRLCRTVRAKVGEDIEDRAWNPNKRNREQDSYMEEVRWRNNAFAWERARGSLRGRDHSEYRKGWLREQIETQRARDRADGEPSQEILPEAFLATNNDNPYQDLLEQRLSQMPGCSPKHANGPTHDREVVDANHHEQEVLHEPSVKITVDDEEHDVVQDELGTNHKFVRSTPSS